MAEEIPDEKMSESVWEKADKALRSVSESIAVQILKDNLAKGHDIEFVGTGIIIKHEDYERSIKEDEE